MRCHTTNGGDFGGCAKLRCQLPVEIRDAHVVNEHERGAFLFHPLRFPACAECRPSIREVLLILRLGEELLRGRDFGEEDVGEVACFIQLAKGFNAIVHRDVAEHRVATFTCDKTG